MPRAAATVSAKFSREDLDRIRKFRAFAMGYKYEQGTDREIANWAMESALDTFFIRISDEEQFYDKSESKS